MLYIVQLQQNLFECNEESMLLRKLSFFTIITWMRVIGLLNLTLSKYISKAVLILNSKHRFTCKHGIEYQSVNTIVANC